MPVAALSGQLAIGDDDGAGLGRGGDALGGIDGIEVENVPLGQGGLQAAHVHGSAFGVHRGTSRCSGSRPSNSSRKLISMARAE